jgi:hypothetical protein
MRWDAASHKNLCCNKYLYFPNGMYTDCLLLIYVTNKGKMLNLHYKYKRK